MQEKIELEKLWLVGNEKEIDISQDHKYLETVIGILLAWRLSDKLNAVERLALSWKQGFSENSACFFSSVAEMEVPLALKENLPKEDFAFPVLGYDLLLVS